MMKEKYWCWVTYIGTLYAKIVRSSYEFPKDSLEFYLTKTNSVMIVNPLNFYYFCLSGASRVLFFLFIQFWIIPFYFVDLAIGLDSWNLCVKSQTWKRLVDVKCVQFKLWCCVVMSNINLPLFKSDYRLGIRDCGLNLILKTVTIHVYWVCMSCVS